MRKLALIIGLAVAGNIVFAQDQKEPRREREVRIEKFKERLQLTDDQVEELKSMRESLKPEFKAIAEDDSKPRSEKMVARAAVVKKQEDQVAEILNDEQEAELEVIKGEIKEKMEKRRTRRKERKDG